MTRFFLRRVRRFVGMVAAVLLAGYAGYRMRDYRTATGTAAGGAGWDLDYFVRPGSFSEVEATRTELEGLAYRYRTEVRTRFLAVSDVGTQGRDHRTSIIQELENALTEFRNAPGESLITQDLLLLLKRSGRQDRWLDVYLDLLYRRPTEEVIALFAPEARILGSATGRTAEVEAALRHVMEIPIDFPAKNQHRGSDVHVTSLPGSTRGGSTL